MAEELTRREQHIEMFRTSAGHIRIEALGALHDSVLALGKLFSNYEEQQGKVNATVTSRLGTIQKHLDKIEGLSPQAQAARVSDSVERAVKSVAQAVAERGEVPSE